VTALDGDVVVVGAGPAGLAAATSCAEVGLDTVLVAPSPDAPWTPTYGCWVDELRSLDLGDLGSLVSASWPSVRVVGHRAHQLPRSYALLDNPRLHGHFSDRFRHAGGRVVAATASGAQHFTWGSRLHLGDGSALDARVLIDATGGAGRLVKGGGPPAAFQSAYGLVARFREPPIAPGTCTLMDWSPSPGISEDTPDDTADDTADPTFLYAMDLGDGRFLVEETSLARRQPLELPELSARLQARLDAAGASPRDVLAEEVVLIPVGGPVPPPQPVVATGAAAGLIHPATGYSVTAGLRAAPVLADALRAAVDAGQDPADLARAAWTAVWPADRRRARRLERYGLDRLLSLRGDGVRSFFDAFFSQPAERWAGYLSGTASSAQVARTMAGVFRSSPWPVRRALAGGRR
jgi:lycopene beta-cyclase